MAGIKIHQYPLERTSFGDEDFYDIDYWDGTGYQSAKVKGSVLKSALGYSFIDIQNNTGGYTLAPTDAGKVVTNGGNPFRDLLINTSLNAPGHTFHIKGRVVVSPQMGVNIDLPNGTTITSPDTFICLADTHYILHRKAYTGTNWVLSAINSETLSNLGSKDLSQLDLIREYEVFEDGTLKFVTNDAFNSAKLEIGENSEERFGEIELNSVEYNKTTAEPNITNNGAGIITRINPNEYEVESRSDIGNSATKRGRIYISPNEFALEKANAGKLTLNSAGTSNTFEDLRATKKGLEYSADYSANFSVRSLVDKAYVDASSKNIANTDLTQTAGQDREYNLNSRQLAFVNSLRLKTTGNQSLTQFAQSFNTSVDDAEMVNNSIAPLLDNTTLDLFWKYKNNMGVVSDLFAKVDKSKVYGGTRYTLIKANGTQEYYTTLSQVVSNWVDGDTLHQFADETINYVSVPTDTYMFLLPSINWNGNGFKITVQGFSSAVELFFRVIDKTVNIYNLNIDININANNTYLFSLANASVLNLLNVNIIQTNTAGFGQSSFIFGSQNTSIINGYNTRCTSLGTIAISGGTATVNAYTGVSTSSVNGIEFNNFRFFSNIVGVDLKLRGARLFGFCNITNSTFLQTFNTSAIEGVSSGVFNFNNSNITYNASSFSTGSVGAINYYDCNVNSLQALTGNFSKMHGGIMSWVGSPCTSSFNVEIFNAYINSSGSRDQIRMNGGSLTIRNSTLMHNDATSNNTNILWVPSITIDLQDSAFINLNNGCNVRGSGLNSGWANCYFNRGANAFFGADGYTNQQLRDANKYRLTHRNDACGNVGHGLVSPFPKMTTAERDALTGVEKGHTIENTTTSFLQVYNGSTWKDLLDLT